jgi:hypothetical protein
LERAKNLYENIFVSLLFVMGITLFYANIGLRAAMEEPLPPGVYGLIITGTFCFACMLRLLWINVIDPIIARKRNVVEKSDKKSQFKINEPALVVAQMLAMVVYTLGITRIGYFTSMFVYLFVTMLTLTNKRNVKAIIIYAFGSFCFCLFLKWAFDVFYIMMPNTPLW